MDKTVVVAVERLVRHRLYRKVIRRLSKFKAHDENNECNAGDLVKIVETRPLSKTKRWRVLELIERKVLPDLALAEVAEEQVAEMTSSLASGSQEVQASEETIAEEPVASEEASEVVAEETIAEEPAAADLVPDQTDTSPEEEAR